MPITTREAVPMRAAGFAVTAKAGCARPAGCDHPDPKRLKRLSRG